MSEDAKHCGRSGSENVRERKGYSMRLFKALEQLIVELHSLRSAITELKHELIRARSDVAAMSDKLESEQPFVPPTLDD